MAIKFDSMRKAVASAEEAASNRGNRTIINFADDTETIVRLVPTNENVPNGIMPIWVHYPSQGIVPRPMISPKTFDKPDPIIEFVDDEIRNAKGKTSKEEFKRLKALEPRLAYIFKAVVRGKESEGTKLLVLSGGSYSETQPFELRGQFGELAKQFDVAFKGDPAPPDWDAPVDGFDIIVKKTGKDKSSTGYPVIDFFIARKATALSDDKALVKKLLTEQPSWKDGYELGDYEKLKSALIKWGEDGDVKSDEDDSDAFASSSTPEAPKASPEKVADDNAKLEAAMRRLEETTANSGGAEEVTTEAGDEEVW